MDPQEIQIMELSDTNCKIIIPHMFKCIKDKMDFFQRTIFKNGNYRHDKM